MAVSENDKLDSYSQVTDDTYNNSVQDGDVMPCIDDGDDGSVQVPSHKLPPDG